MARTLVTGNILRSGSIPTTALGGGVVTSSLQIVASLPTGSLSSSAQVNYPDISNIPGGIASSSAQIKDYLPTGTVSSSTQLPSGIASSSAQVTAYLPTGTVSSSGQISVFNTINGDQLATTGSNTFTAPQTISDTTNSTSYLDGALHVAGGMSVRKDVRVSGSMTINGLLTAVSMSTQYVTSSEYVVGTSRITLNDDDNVRFAGLSIIDSGSASPTSASIFWDSLQHRFIYENLSGSAYNSSIIIAGPKHTGTLGDEPTLTSGYIPYATGTDHIDNSVMFQSSSRIGIGSTNPSYPLDVRGSVGGYAASFGGATYQLRIYTDTAQAQINDGVGQYIQFRSDSTFMTFATNNAERLRIDANGNLGLGVTPSTWSIYDRVIQVANNGASFSSWTADYTGAGYLFLNNNAYFDGTDWKYFAARGTAQYRMNNAIHSWHIAGSGTINTAITFTQAMTLDASGNLLVGRTTANNNRLTIAGTHTSGRSIAAIQTTAAGNGNNVLLGFYNSADTRIGYIGVETGGNFEINAQENVPMIISTNGIERMRINSSGNVGIGTTSPGYALDVVATGTSAIPMRIRGASASTNNTQLRFYGANAGADLWAIGNALPTNDASRNFDIYDLVAGANRVRIDDSGFVGIGTTNPATLLYVKASGNYGTITCDNSTNTGGGSFAVRKNGSTIGVLTNKGAWYGDTTNDLALAAETGYNVRIYTDGTLTEKFIVTTAGNVGIGITNPGYKLDVAGSLNATSIRQITTTDVGNKYGRKVVGAQSSFDNPVVNLATVGNASNFVLIFRITVFQSVIAGNYGNVQVGYAYARAGNNEVTSMTIQQTIGSATAGTLSWSGSTLRFTPVRYGNYDVYNIIVELSGEDNLSSF